jgi:hypothetical protein
MNRPAQVPGLYLMRRQSSQEQGFFHSPAVSVDHEIGGQVPQVAVRH